MGIARLIRHLLPPTVAVLISLCLLLLNKEGLGSLKYPEILVLIVIFAVACWALFRPLRSAEESEESEEPGESDGREEPEPSKRTDLLSAIVPFLVLISGPAIGAVFWALDVFVLESDRYSTWYERLEELQPSLSVGLIAGVIGFVIVITRAGKK